MTKIVDKVQRNSHNDFIQTNKETKMNHTKETEHYIDHEVRVRLLEKLCEKIDFRFQHLENKMDNQFKWTIGIMITMFGSLIITKLI